MTRLIPCMHPCSNLVGANLWSTVTLPLAQTRSLGVAAVASDYGSISLESISDSGESHQTTYSGARGQHPALPLLGEFGCRTPARSDRAESGAIRRPEKGRIFATGRHIAMLGGVAGHFR